MCIRDRVRASGCCRDDAEIADAERSLPWEGAAGWAALAGGPAFALGLLAALAEGVVLTTLVGALGPQLEMARKNQGKPNDLQTTGSLACISCSICAPFAFGMVTPWPFLVGIPTGLFLVLWPPKAALDDAQLETPSARSAP